MPDFSPWKSTPPLLCSHSSLLRYAEEIPLGTPEVESAARPTVTPSLIADKLAKLAQLRDSGVLSEDEFVTLKTQLIQEATG